MHLRFRIRLQKLLVERRICGGIGVGHGAVTWGSRATRRVDGDCAGTGISIEVSGPAGARADIVEVGCAVCVGLGEFAVHCGAPSCRRVVGGSHDAGPAAAGEVDFVGMVELELAYVEDLVLVGVEHKFGIDVFHHVGPFGQGKETVAEDDDLFDSVLADERDGLFVPRDY